MGFFQLPLRQTRGFSRTFSGPKEPSTAPKSSRTGAGVLPEVLFDPQTSGGLLIGVGPDRGESLCAALQRAGYAQARVIGRVGERSPHAGIVIR